MFRLELSRLISTTGFWGELGSAKPLESDAFRSQNVTAVSRPVLFPPN
jgi:hypothetical protein